jgi:arsenate reductase
VIREVGIDISGQKSKHLDAFAGQRFDFVITVCDKAKVQCPVWPGAREHIHWSLDDPGEATGSEEEQLVVFRRVRDEIRQRIAVLLRKLCTGHVRSDRSEWAIRGGGSGDRPTDVRIDRVES